MTQGKAVRLDGFVPGSRLKTWCACMCSTRKLRLLVLDTLERIEMAARVAGAFAGPARPACHEKPACLHGNFTKKVIAKGPDAGKTQHQVWVAKYRSMLHRARKEPFVAHHQQQYGALPIWAAVEVWDFGLLSKLFAGMQHADQQTIAALYDGPSGQAFAQWLRSLNFIRNVSAHSRLWNINVLDYSAVFLPDAAVAERDLPEFKLGAALQELAGE